MTNEERAETYRKTFGYTLRRLQRVNSSNGTDNGIAEPIAAMGTDTPLAMLSDERTHPLFNYFKQLICTGYKPPN